MKPVQRAALIAGPLASLTLILFVDLAPERPEVTRMAAVAVWIAVWWITEAIPLAATSLLTMIAYRFLLGNLVPKVSYLTRLDVFIFGATILVFVALMEALVTARLANRDRIDAAHLGRHRVGINRYPLTRLDDTSQYGLSNCRSRCRDGVLQRQGCDNTTNDEAGRYANRLALSRCEVITTQNELAWIRGQRGETVRKLTRRKGRKDHRNLTRL